MNDQVQDLLIWKSRAEVEIRQHNDEIKSLFEIMGEQTEAMKQSTSSMNALSVELRVLASRLNENRFPCEEHAEEIDSLKLTRAEQKGGLKVIGGLMAGSSLLSSAVTWIVAHWDKKP